MAWLKVLEVALAVLAVIALHNAVLKTARANGGPVQRVSDADHRSDESESQAPRDG